MAGKNQSIQIIPMHTRAFPLRKDIVGDAGRFVDMFLQEMRCAAAYEVMGVKPDKSFLITGSPGNGKSMSIDVLVNEANKEILNYKDEDEDNSFNAPGLELMAIKYDIGRYGTAYINEGAKIVQKFFDSCFAIAEFGLPTLIVFDEADNLFGKRQDIMSHKEDSKVLETIMKNMQELHYKKDMYVVMMSNFPDAFDEASIRAGRVDRKIQFNSPKLEEREFAYDNAIRNMNNKVGYKVIRGYDPSELARLSDGFSYSDVVESVNSAIKNKARKIFSVDNNKIIETNIWITQKGIRESIEDHKRKFITSSKRSIGFLSD